MGLGAKIHLLYLFPADIGYYSLRVEDVNMNL